MRRAALVAAALVLGLAAPALGAENPVLDAEGDADVAEALAEATEVQGVCYGYELFVNDADTGQFGGRFVTSNLGPSVGIEVLDERCPRGALVLSARIDYTSEFSEAEDSASWSVDGNAAARVSISDVEDLGLSAEDLLDDDRSETTLRSAVLALPRLAAETGAVPPVLLEENTAPLPADARPTGTPGSDWLRENGALLAFCVLLVVGGVVVLLLSFRTVRRGAGALGSIIDL